MNIIKFIKYYDLYFGDCFQDDDLELTYFLLSPDDKVFFLLLSIKLYFVIGMCSFQSNIRVPLHFLFK